jgi:hypothetical protein
MVGEQEPATANGGPRRETGHTTTAAPTPTSRGDPGIGDQAQSTAELVELDRDACLRLLADRQIGRLVFTEGALPAAQPVTYLLDGEEIIFRTADDSKRAAATRNAVVAFQVDQIDPTIGSGWSVLGVGQAYEVTDPDRLATLPDRAPAPQVPGPPPHTIAIPLQRLTGRQLWNV